MLIGKTKNKIWFLSIISLYIILFLIGSETFMISPILPVIASDLNVEIEHAAYAITAYVLAYAIAAPFMAYIADRIGHGIALLFGVGVFMLGNIIATQSVHLMDLVVARGIGGLGGAFAGPAIWALIVKISPTDVRSGAIGLGMASFSLGQVIGVPVGTLMAVSFGWRTAFAAIACLSAFSLLGAVITRVGAASSHAIHDEQSAASENYHKGILAPWRGKKTALTLITTILFQMSSLGAYSYLGVILSKSGLSFGEKDLGTIGIAVGIGSVLGSILAGRLSDQARKRALNEAGRIPVWSALLIASLIMMTLVIENSNALSGLAAIFIIVIWFISSGAFVTDSQAIVTGALPEARALASAWNITSMYIGTAMGVSLLGCFTFSWGTLLGISAIPAALSIFSSIALIRA